MAVAHDAVSESHGAAAGSINEASFTWSHNPTGVPRGVTVFVVNLVSANPIVSSVTYDGIAVPEVTACQAFDAATEPGNVQVFHLGTGVPTTDPANVVVNRTNNADELWAVAITQTAAADKDTAIHEAGIVKLEGDGTLAEQSVTDGSPGSNSVRYAGGFSGLAAFPPTGASSTALHNFDTGNQTAAVVRETTAGQGARNVGFSSGTSDDRAIVHYAVKEVPVAQTVSPAALAMSLAAVAPTRVDQDLSPAANAMALGLLAPTITQPAGDQEVSPAAIAMTLAAVAPRVDQELAPGSIAVTLVPIAPSRIDQQIVPGAIAMTLGVPAPVISAEAGDQSVSPAAIAMTLGVVAPLRVDQQVTPGTIVMALAAPAPAVNQEGGAQTVSPPSIALTLTPLAPRVDLTVAPAPIALTVAVVAPLRIDQQVLLAAIGLALVAVAPSITGGAVVSIGSVGAAPGGVIVLPAPGGWVALPLPGGDVTE